MANTGTMFIAGCSNAAGFDLQHPGDSEYNRNNSFGNLFARKMGYTPINAGVGGATNTAIARSVLHYVHSLDPREYSNNYVLIAWTDIDRLDMPWQWHIDHTYSNPHVEYYSEDFKLFNHINVNWAGLGDEQALLPPYHDFIANNQTYMEIVTAQSIIMLQNYLENRGIPYTMTNTMHMFNKFDSAPDPAVELYKSWINCANYHKPFDNSGCFYWYYRDLGYANRGDFWHHGSEAHSAYADLLYDFVMS